MQLSSGVVTQKENETGIAFKQFVANEQVTWNGGGVT